MQSRSCIAGFGISMANPNLSQLIAAAKVLRPMLGELVFVGGCVTGLLITDEAAADPRGTLDVDAIAKITSYAEYTEFGERLRALGFKENTSEDAPLCRWVHTRIVLDVMPLDEAILGFSNRWYEAATKSAEIRRLAPDLNIRIVTVSIFLATKIEAFKGRGKGISSGVATWKISSRLSTAGKAYSQKLRAKAPGFALISEARFAGG